MDSTNQLNYKTIINYLMDKKLCFALGSSSTNKINLFLNKYEFVYFGVPEFSTELDYFLASLIFCLNKNVFSSEAVFDIKLEDFKHFLKENKVSNNYLDIAKFFKINIFIITKKDLHILPSNNIVDIYLPHILIYYEDNKFYPCTINNKEILFFNTNNDFISSYYEQTPSVFNNLYQNYQILDDIETSINNFLGIEDNYFINESEVEKIQNLTKFKKAELINLLLSKSDYKKSVLNKMKKSELIKLLN